MAERLARAGVVSLLGAMTGAAAGLALSLVVGRSYGDEGTGVVYTCIAVFTIAANVLELGADTGLVRQLSRLRALGQEHRVRSTVVAAVVPVVIVGVPAVAVLTWLVPGALDAATGEALRGVLPLALCASLLAVLLAATRGLGQIAPFTAVWNVGLPVSRPLLVLVVAAAGLGAAGAVGVWAWAVVPATAVALVLTIRAVRRLPRPVHPGGTRPRDRVRDAAELWRFSGPRGLAAALEILLSWVDVVIVAVLTSPAEAGVYAVVTRAVTAGLVVDTAARVAVSPRISEHLAVGDLEATAHLQRQTAQAMVVVAWPFYLTLAIFAPAVLGLFGPDFSQGARATALLCAAMMVLVAAGTTQTVLLMGGRSWWQLANKTAALLVLVAGSIVLVPRWGLEGAAVAWALAILVDTALALYQVHARMGVPRHVVAPLVSALVVSTVVGTTGTVVAVVGGRDLASLGVHLAVSLVVLGPVVVHHVRRLTGGARGPREHPPAPPPPTATTPGA